MQAFSHAAPKPKASHAAASFLRGVASFMPGSGPSTEIDTPLRAPPSELAPAHDDCTICGFPCLPSDSIVCSGCLLPSHFRCNRAVGVQLPAVDETTSFKCPDCQSRGTSRVAKHERAAQQQQSIIDLMSSPEQEDKKPATASMTASAAVDRSSRAAAATPATAASAVDLTSDDDEADGEHENNDDDDNDCTDGDEVTSCHSHDF